ncbi:MAG TPA: efflux RND transporter periplasmic adaptor subunit [Thermodesulfobacteriota bacterium]|nr:efflux RND transporter periplasmic adaptor subunit [Thermodesulfobacteriota bacterium]
MKIGKNGSKQINLSLILLFLLSGFLSNACGCRKQAPPPTIPEVTAITVKTEPVVLTTKLPGRTSPFRIAEIRPQVSGVILKRWFEEGSDVKAGHELYLIDPAPFQAALDNANAALARAEANLPAIKLREERYQVLLQDGAVGQQDYDDAVAALKQARAEIAYWKAQVESARINLGYCHITAPISGRIGRSNVTEGAVVTAYQATSLATIHQLDPIYVDVPQSTTELLSLRQRLEKGHLKPAGTIQNQVQLFLEDGTTYPLEGTFQFRDVSVDPTTGSVILRMVFPNPNSILFPEMFAQAVIKEGVKENAILIPQPAVNRNPKGETFALIVDRQGKVEQRRLTLDRAINDKWLVSAGLASGEQVIVEGIQWVKPGMLVKAAPFPESKIGPKPKTGGETPPKNRREGGN